MAGTTFSVELRNLIVDYCDHLISFEEYRVQRKIILDRIDEEYNGVNLLKTQPRADFSEKDKQ